MRNLVFINRLIEADKELFLFLNSFHSSFWDEIMWAISGRFVWIPLYSIVLFLIILKFKKKSIIIILSAAIIIAICDQISVQLFKEIFHRLRPSHDPKLMGLVHLVDGYAGGMFGFVSSHAANSFALATFASLLFRNKYLSAIMFIWAILVCYSRIYLGVHFPGDIICGGLTGALLAWIGYYFLKKYLYRKGNFQ